MMSDAEMRAADAEYRALPGTPSDLRITCPFYHDLIKDQCALYRTMGYNHVRATVHDEKFYLEFWWERPYKEGPFNRGAV